MDLLFGFSGRIGRLQWWLGQLAIFIVIALGIGIIVMLAGSDKLTGEGSSDGLGSAGLSVILVICAVAVLAIWINIASTVKRFHDRDKSGFWFFITFVPYIGSIWVLVECGFLAGSPGSNNYGPSPGSGSSSAFGDLEDVIAMQYSQPEQPRRVTPAVQPVPAARQQSSQARRSTPSGFGRRGVS
jgi:uncharacterized membrane protein YhaH (DUF805 family)